MVQAQGIMLRDNVRTIGQMIRLYTNKNSTLNGTGEERRLRRLAMPPQPWPLLNAAIAAFLG